MMDIEKRLEPAMTAMRAWGNRDGQTLAQIAKQYDLKSYDDLAMWIAKEIIATYREAVNGQLQRLETAPRLVAFETRKMRQRRKSHLD